MKVKAVPDAIVLTISPKKIREANANLIGQILQNQHATANIYVRSGGDGWGYLRLQPGGDFLQDILPPQDEVWAYSDVDGAVLTYWEKYLG